MGIIGLIKNSETKVLELKETLPTGEGIAKTVIAFSNTAGGKLIIGVEDNLTIKGITTEEADIFPDKIVNMLHDLCYPSILPEIYLQSIEDKIVLVVEIYPGNLRPYYLRSKGKEQGVYIRIGATNKQADVEMIAELERQRLNISYDELEEIFYKVSDKDIENLKKSFFKYTGKILDKDKMLNLKLFKENGNKLIPTKGLVLLCDTSKYFSHSIVRCARFKGDDVTEFIDQKEFTGPIFEQVEDTIKFLKNHINKAGIIEDVRRKDEYEIPIAALREAVTNAVIHRNYSLTGCDIKVMVFDGSVRILSPGTLTRSLSVDEIKRGRSEIRNKVIARFMRELNFIEQWGTGIRRMITLCSQQNIPEPEFIETNMAFEVIFKRQLSANYPQLSANYPQLSANETKVLKLFELNTPITKKQVEEYLNVSASTAKLVLSKLKKENIIISEGSSRATSYKLNITR